MILTFSEEAGDTRPWGCTINNISAVCIVNGLSFSIKGGSKVWKEGESIAETAVISTLTLKVYHASLSILQCYESYSYIILLAVGTNYILT